MKEPKIFPIQGDYPFCFYTRAYLPAVYSGQTTVSEFLRKDADISTARIPEKAMEADIIVFQRPTSRPSYDLAVLLKKKGKKIVFDNDDSYSGIPLERLENERQREIAGELNKNLNDFVKIADGVTVSTEFLKKEYSKINLNTIVLKNCIDPLDEFPCKKNETGKFRVGFVGSVTSNDDYIHIKDQIRRLDERGDITLVIMGVKFADGTIMKSMGEDAEFWASLKNVEWHHVVHITEYMMTLANLALDLAIIPRKEYDFNRAKSNLKFLEMSLLRIPVLAQGFSDGTSPYQGVDEPYMTIVIDNAEWYNEIVKVKEKYSHYSSLALQAHDYVIKNYNIKTFAHYWKSAIIDLTK